MILSDPQPDDTYAIRWMRLVLAHLVQLEALEVDVWESEGGATR